MPRGRNADGIPEKDRQNTGRDCRKILSAKKPDPVPVRVYRHLSAHMGRSLSYPGEDVWRESIPDRRVIRRDFAGGPFYAESHSSHLLSRRNRTYIR